MKLQQQKEEEEEEEAIMMNGLVQEKKMCDRTVQMADHTHPMWGHVVDQCLDPVQRGLQMKITSHKTPCRIVMENEEHMKNTCKIVTMTWYIVRFINMQTLNQCS